MKMNEEIMIFSMIIEMNKIIKKKVNNMKNIKQQIKLRL